jgi:hypothetical protein
MITENTRPYETLIRHNNDGTVSAHHCVITELARDGKILSATIGDPQTLTQAGGALNFATVLGTVAAATLLANDALTTQAKEQSAFLKTTTDSLTEQTALLKTTTDSLAEAQIKVTAFEEKAAADLLVKGQ